jgi:hypothetical protein
MYPEVNAEWFLPREYDEAERVLRVCAEDMKEILHQYKSYAKGLLVQNNLLQKQNELLRKQNKALEEQLSGRAAQSDFVAGSVGLAFVNGEWRPAKLLKISPDEQRVRVMLQDGRSGVVGRDQFKQRDGKKSSRKRLG